MVRTWKKPDLWRKRKAQHTYGLLFQVSAQRRCCVHRVGSVWHAGGSNFTTDRERLALFISHNCGWLRQQENQVISVPREIVREMPELLQRRLGWKTGIFQVDFRDHLDVLKDGHVVNPAAKVVSPGWGKL